MEPGACVSALQSLGAGLESSSFNDWRKAFVQEHMHVFNFSEENKLEYTAIHNQYVEGLERHLESLLPAGTSMKALEHALVTQPDAFRDLDEATSGPVKLLLEAGDFVAFREMMLFEKQRSEDLTASPTVLGQMAGGDVPDLDGVLDRCQRLAAMASADGWENVLTSDWMVIDKMAVEESQRTSPAEIYLRGVWTMNLSVIECCDMMFSFDERRRGWDKNFVSVAMEKGSSLQEDDVVVTSEIDFGFLLHMAGVPRKLTSRLWHRWDYPIAGTVTGAMIPWRMPDDVYDTENSILSLKITSIASHPSDPGKCIMTTIESNKFGRMPRWVLSILTSVTAPQIMKGLEGRYISSMRNSGGVVDVTRFRST